MTATYALYKGDELLDVGTLRELAERRDVKEETIYFYSMPSYKRRGNGKDRLLVIRLKSTESRRD